MEQDTTNNDALKARRDALRERLRAKCELVVEAVEALPEPKTFIDAERAARTVMVADKMVLQVFSEPKSVKSDVRFGSAGHGFRREYSRSRRTPVDRTGNAPIVSLPLSRQERFTGSFSGSSPIHFAVNSYAKGEDEVSEDIDLEPETPLSKTYLKMEQIVAKITAMDAEICGQKSSKQGP